ncbi:MAG: hypothetical protein QXG39_04700 [Candidatus Aenigmatarchaeota archaeon]
MNFVELVLSDYFIWFLILIVCCVIFVPFGIYGLFKFKQWLWRQHLLPRKGYIQVTQKLPNDKKRVFYALPTGGYIKIKTLEGDEIQVPVKLEKDWVAFDGNICEIMLDEQGRQMPYKMGIHSSIPHEEITKGWKAAYETGKLVGSMLFWDELKRLLLIGIVVMIIIVGVAGILSYLNYQKLSSFDVTMIANVVYERLMNLTYKPPVV